MLQRQEKTAVFDLCCDVCGAKIGEASPPKDASEEDIAIWAAQHSLIARCDVHPIEVSPADN